MKVYDNTAFALEEREYYNLNSNINSNSNENTSNKNKFNNNYNKKKHSNLGIAVCGLVVTILLFVMIYGKVQVSALYTQISQEKSAVEILESENVRMQSEIEGNMSLRNVESYAEDVLGLKKLDKSQIVYIQIQNEDVVQVVDSKENIFVSIKEKFNSIIEYLFG
ncbi:MAG: septum formation inhibitor [Ruminococcus sp.]|nr:septum formation inhibitor [Ruminococcus sp.]